MQWIKTGKKNTSFHQIETPDSSFVIGIIGLSPSDREWQLAVGNHDFRVSASGRILLRRGAIKFSEARSIFSGASITDIPSEQVYIRRKKPADRSVLPDTQVSTFIGKNYLGQDVYSTSTGSRYINGRDGQPVSEETAAVAPAFLRATRPGDIDLCADGFVLRMETEHLRANDLRAFCGAIHSEQGPVEATDSRLRDVQEAVEAAIFRRSSRIIHESGDIKSGFEMAALLSDHQPPMDFRTSTSVDLQQYSTPVTLSIAAQYALGDMNGKTLLEPTIGNASLVSAMSGASITGVELDKARYQRTKLAIEKSAELDAGAANIIHGDFLEAEFDEQFDAVIANPPLGGLPKAVVYDGLRVTRIDHLIMLKSLRHRKDDGRAVFVIGADRDTMFKGNEGKISGGSERLFAWLSDHYDIRAFEIAGGLYKKQGASFPVRVVAVGKKRSDAEARRAKETHEFRIDKLSVVDKIEDLWAQASSVRTFLNNGLEAPKETPDEQEILASEAAKAEEEIVNPSFGNDYQSQYIPMSPGNTSAMIPKNMVVSQQVAFNRFMEDHPDPVEFVKSELKMDDLSGFEPEQIDAIALGIWNMKRGRALILADQTGMGKGRVVAAIARWAALSERQCNFLTEKAGLFSDLWRDVRDIGSESIFTPFIMNADEKIVSLDGEEQEVLVQKTTNAVRNRLIESGMPPIEEGYNLMLATYSQFNRPEVKSAKSGYIKNASRDGVIIMDESHNAAGDSNTGRNITEAVMTAKSALYSSATFAKNAKNMGVYHKAFPASVNLESLTETLIAGGEPLQEILSAMLCEDGVLVRREHDLSHLKFTTLDVPSATLKRNEDLSDQVSDILAAMSYFSGDVEKIAKELDEKIRERLGKLTNEQREGKRLGVSYTNFGSRLYTISRQFALILSTDQVADNAIRALQNGQKPVVVLEQTMESIMTEMEDNASMDDLAEAEEMSGAERRIGALTIRDLLLRLLNKMMYIVRTDDYGTTERVSVFEASTSEEERKSARKAVDSIRKMIDALPEIRAMPIDQITHRLVSSGYTCGEVSGRSTTYFVNEDGTVTAEKNLREKNTEIFKFNSGEYDAIVLTRSGCTGVSLHASEKFADRRQRVMIEAQIAQNVNERVQFFGRVNRRGQVSSPEIWSVTSGLPWENRSLAMQNMKLRKLSANTQSNRNNAAEMKDIPDILNPIGNEVCKSYLLNNPEIAARLSIDLDYEEEGQNEDGCYFAKKLTGRLCLLHVVDQRNIYSEITSEYHKTLSDLSQKGINPLESRVLDVKAEVKERKLLIPGQESGSVFDAPVFAEKIEWNENVEPIRSEKAVNMANLSIQRLCDENSGFTIDERTLYQLPYDQRERTYAPHGLKMIDPSAILERAMEGFNASMLRAIPAKFENKDDPAVGVKMALADKNMNAVKRMHARSLWLSDNLPHLMPGCPINFSSEEGAITGIITSVTPPGPGKEFYLGAWEIRVLPVGSQATVAMTYNTLIDDAEFAVLPNDYRKVYSALDAAPAGKLCFTKWTLTGNLFRAAEIAAKSRMGRAGIYTDKNGFRHRAILCNSSVNLSDLFTVEISLSEADAKKEMLNIFATKDSGEIVFDKEFRLQWKDHGKQMRLITPGTKSIGGRVFLDEKLREFTGEFSGSRQIMSAEFHGPKDMDGFVAALYRTGLSIKKRVDSNPEVAAQKQKNKS